MEKATKIPDVLAVQEQLTGVRQQIEELTAQKQSLENQAALATLTVNFTPPPAVAVTEVSKDWDPAREIDRAAASLVGLGQDLASGGIWFVVVWLPILLVIGLLVVMVLAVIRRVGRPATRPATPPPRPQLRRPPTRHRAEGGRPYGRPPRPGPSELLAPEGGR